MVINWYIFSLISALFSAGASIGEKKALFKENVLNFSLLLAVVNFILAIPFFIFMDFPKLTLLTLSILFIKSAFEAGAFVCVMVGIKNLELSKALPLLILTPGLVAIFAFILLGEALTIKEIGGLILLMGGLFILSSKKEKEKKKEYSKKKTNNKKIYLFLIIALILFTTTALLDKTLLKSFKIPINEFIGFQHLFIALIFIIVAIFLKNKTPIRQTIKTSWKIILLISAFTIIYRYTNLLAVKDAPVALALAIKRTSVLIAVVIGGKFFKEKNLFTRIIATLLMTTGAILIIFG